MPTIYWFFRFLTEEIQYHDGLRSRELGQAPILLCAPNSSAGVIISPAQTDGLTVLATGQRQYAKLVHYQPSYNTSHTMKSSHPLLLYSPMALCTVGCIPQAKFPSLDTQSPPGFPGVTILSASSVRTLVPIEMKHSRPEIFAKFFMPYLYSRPYNYSFCLISISFY